MRPNKFILATLAGLLVAGGTAAVGGEMSTIRRAAIEKLQSKLGTIRGTIKPKAEHIFLTVAMIERLKPIRPAKNKPAPVARQGDIDRPVNSFPDPDFVIAQQDQMEQDIIATADAQQSDQLQREIYAAAALPLPSELIDTDLVTTSTSTAAMPDTADMNLLLDAVDAMIARRR